VRLAEIIDEGELRAQLDHARSIRFSRKELIWLAGNTFYGKTRMFSADFIGWLASLLADGLMRDFARVRIPLASPYQDVVELPMFIVRHRHYQKDPAHCCIRAQLEAVAATAAAG
jgi:hypothetical protein